MWEAKKVSLSLEEGQKLSKEQINFGEWEPFAISEYDLIKKNFKGETEGWRLPEIWLKRFVR